VRAALALVSTFLVDGVAALCCLAVFCGFLLYFAFYSRHRVITSAPDERLAG
jgi:ethanolamine permease